MIRRDAWREVAFLIPKRVRDRHKDAVEAVQLDVSVLLALLPSHPEATPDAAGHDLPAEADALAWRAWIARLIEALPTHTPFSQEVANGVA